MLSMCELFTFLFAQSLAHIKYSSEKNSRVIKMYIEYVIVEKENDHIDDKYILSQYKTRRRHYVAFVPESTHTGTPLYYTQ